MERRLHYYDRGHERALPALCGLLRPSAFGFIVFLRLLRPAMLAYIAHHDKSMLQFFFKRLDILAPVMPSIDS